MNRQSFLKRLFGIGAATAVSPMIFAKISNEKKPVYEDKTPPENKYGLNMSGNMPTYDGRFFFTGDAYPMGYQPFKLDLE